ncbi:MAG: hypothetical protein HGB11_09155, partial [Chlorobiales bacterium]|nr:hypothetical protein [Chlorobiales bacterium]
SQGLRETERSLANKISRGSFSFVFFLLVMRVLGVKTVSLESTEKTAGLLFSGDLVSSDKGGEGA